MEMNKIIRIAGNPPRADNAQEYSNPGIRLGDSPVMLSAAKHLAAQRDKPFVEFTLSATNGLRVTPGGSDMHDNAVMLSRSEASRGLSRQTLRFAQGDSVRADFIIRLIF